MKILGIETSCDETALAMVEGEGERLRVVHSGVLSQIKTHEKYGGVVPEVAARNHIKAIFPMLDHEVGEAWREADAIAVTAGPGLAPALRVGVEAAKTLAWLSGKPLIGVSHMEGHIYANWLTDGAAPKLPLLALLVSGGHTELVVMRDHGDCKKIGETIDDAAGEAFDKVAQMLGLPYPGGPQISKLAQGGDVKAFDFPRGLLDRPGFDFSFSGLKTSVLYMLRKEEASINDPTFRANIAASFQEAVIDALAKKTLRAIAEIRPASLVIAGGVSANTALRERMEQIGREEGIDVHLPPLAYTMDNAAMIAAAGYFRHKNGVQHDPLTLIADPNLEIAS